MYDRSRRSPDRAETEAQVVDEDHWVLIVSPKVHRAVDLRFPESEWEGARSMPESFLDHLLTSRIFRKVSS